MSYLKELPILGRKVRQDPWPQLGQATIRQVDAAMAAGHADEAIELLHYAVDEYRTIRDIYSRWNRDMVRYLVEHIPGATVAGVLDATLTPWLGELFGHVRLRPQADDAGIRFFGPDGEQVVRIFATGDEGRYALALGNDPDATTATEAQRDAIAALIRAGDVEGARSAIASLIVYARTCHDVLADWAWALLSHGARQLGEAQMDDMFRRTLGDWVKLRYALIGQMTGAERAIQTIEGMRGHFCGEGRLGDVEVVEEPDRWVVSFDPCGSGGRMRRGDPLNRTGSRLDPPFNFVNVQGAYDWTWGEQDVCLYCAHCSIVNDILPVEEVGFPLRVTEWPRNPGDKCRWILYKQPEWVPESAYRRVGKEKPAELRERARHNPPPVARP